MEITSKKNLASALDFEIEQELKQALAGSIIWFLFALFFIPRLLRKEDNDDHYIVIGCSVVGVITGIIGYLLPTNWNDWILFGLYPVGFNLILFVAFAAYGNRNK